MGPDALGVPGPCFAARETSENLQMISRRRKRLTFAPAASDVRFSDCVKRLFRSGIGAATALRPQSRWGHALWSGEVMATPTFCHALPTARRLRRLDSLALCCDDVKAFSPEHGPCQIKFFRWPHRPAVRVRKRGAPWVGATGRHSHLRSGALRGAARVTVSPSLGRKIRLELFPKDFGDGQTTR